MLIYTILNIQFKLSNKYDRDILLPEKLGGQIMAKLKKAIASLVACALMISMLTLDVMAASVSFPVGDATVTVYWSKTSTSATVSVASNKQLTNVSMSIVGTYYAKGTMDVKTVSNGNGGTTSTSTSILNFGGTWISLNATVSVSYGGYSKSVPLKL